MTRLDIQSQIALLEIDDNPPSVGQQYTYSDLCFPPKLLLCVGIHNTGPSITVDPSDVMFGVWANDKQYCMSVKMVRVTGGGGGYDAVRRFENDKFALCFEGGATNHAVMRSMHVTEVTDTGFTVEIDEATGASVGQLAIAVICIGGSDFDVDVVNWQMPTSTGNIAVGDADFTPSAAIHCHITTDQIATTVSNGFMGTGMSAGSMEIANAVFSADGATPSNAHRVQRTGTVLLGTDSARNIELEATHVSYDAGGVTLNFITAPATEYEVITILLGGSWDGLTFNPPAIGVPPAYQALPMSDAPYITFISSDNAVAGSSVVNHAALTFGGITQYANQQGNLDYFDQTTFGLGTVHNSSASGTSAAGTSLNASTAIRFFFTNPSTTAVHFYSMSPHIDSECTDPPVWDYEWFFTGSTPSIEIGAIFIARDFSEVIIESDVHISELVIEVLTIDSEEPEPPEEICLSTPILALPACPDLPEASRPVARTRLGFLSMPLCGQLPVASHPELRPCQ